MCDEDRPLGSKGTFGIGKLRAAIVEKIKEDGADASECWMRPPHTFVSIEYHGVVGVGFADKCNKDTWDDAVGREVATTRAYKDVAGQFIQDAASADSDTWRVFVQHWLPDSPTRDALIDQGDNVST